jgi:hypothetical protein
MRAVVERAAGATDSEIAALALEAWAARRLKTFEDAERGLCFGTPRLRDRPRGRSTSASLGARRRR